MVGFSFKKKSEEAAPKKTGFGGFSLKKKESGPIKKAPLRPFGKVEKEDDEDKVVHIDTFDSKDGAYDKETGPDVKETRKLVIANAGNGDWRQQTKQRFNPNGSKAVEEEQTQKLEYGINFIASEKKSKEDTTSVVPKSELELFKEDLESRPEAATEEDYDEVPIEEFGAAMLRGMGWKDEDEDKGEDEGDERKRKEKEQLVIRPKQLGLGAKAVPVDGDDAVGGRDYMPPLRMVKKDNSNGGRTRERSPNRLEAASYRDRT